MTIFETKEAAKYLKISEQFLRMKAKEGVIPGRQVGSKWLFVKEKLDKFLTEEDELPEVSVRRVRKSSHNPRFVADRKKPSPRKEALLPSGSRPTSSESASLGKSFPE